MGKVSYFDGNENISISPYSTVFVHHFVVRFCRCCALLHFNHIMFYFIHSRADYANARGRDKKRTIFTFTWNLILAKYARKFKAIQSVIRYSYADAVDIQYTVTESL